MINANRIVAACWMCVSLVFAFSSAYRDPPTIDGVFSEWSDDHLAVQDAKGDATAAFDVTKVAARTNGSELYLHFNIGNEINLQNGQDSEGTLCVVLNLPQERQLTIDFRARTATLDGEERVPWSTLNFTCLPTYASAEYELRVDLQEFDLAEGDEIQIDFSGSDELDEAITVVLDEAKERTASTFLATPPEGHIRIANQNTLWQGIADPVRSGFFKRLLKAANADIYCFQEESKEDKFREAARHVLPMRDVNLHWSGGCGIAASLPLEPIAMGLNCCAAALIELPDENHLVVISVHLKCCGYAGSREDRMRIEQAEQLAQQIRKLRDGDFGDKCKDAGIVVIGDYNLVGSRKPLEVLRDVGLNDLLLHNGRDGSAYTWRGTREEESFWPGRLDLITYDPSVLRPTAGLVFDTARLSKLTLENLGLQATDSLASDHLLLVADFRFAR